MEILRGRGWQKQNILKKSMEFPEELGGGGGAQNKKPSIGEIHCMDIF